jgi:hypothetical protein
LPAAALLTPWLLFTRAGQLLEHLPRSDGNSNEMQLSIDDLHVVDRPTTAGSGCRGERGALAAPQR